MKWDSVRAVSNIWFLSEVLFQLISITGEILTMLGLLVLLWSVKDCCDIYFSRFQPSDRLQFMPMKELKSLKPFMVFYVPIGLVDKIFVQNFFCRMFGG